MPTIRQSELADADRCPRLYFFNWVVPQAATAGTYHTAFGSLFHLGVETYYKLKARRGHELAMRVAVKRVMRASHKFVGENSKNRFTLVRSVVFYCEHYRRQQLCAKTFQGRAFVEYRVELDTNIPSFTGESWIISCGLDRIMEETFSDYIIDIKTTKFTLDDKFFDTFKRDVQTFTYTLACNTLKNPPSGIMIEGVQLLVNDTRFQRKPIDIPSHVVEDWANNSLPQILTTLDKSFTTGIWPQHLPSCNTRYGPCRYFDLCHMPAHEIEDQIGCTIREATAAHLTATQNKTTTIVR